MGALVCASRVTDTHGCQIGSLNWFQVGYRNRIMAGPSEVGSYCVGFEFVSVLVIFVLVNLVFDLN